MMKQKDMGSITVFLSLILLLVMAVIMTTVESARVSVGKVFADRALAAAMDSIMAEFYVPLFQDYHIFGLDGSYGNDTLELDRIVSKMEESMEYTFLPNKDLYYYDKYFPVENTNLLQVKTNNLQIENVNTLLDYNGDLFSSQAISYMKYKELGNIVEGFLNKISVIDEAKQAQTVLKEKLKTEESIYQIDKDITKLMKLIDGITITEKGIKKDKNGIRIQDNFVKKLCVLPVTSINVGVYNPIVFQPLQSHYTDPLTIIDGIIGDIDALISNLMPKEEARIAYETISQIDESSITDQEERKLHKQALVSAYETWQSYIQIEQDLLKEASNKIKKLEKLMNSVSVSIDDAIPVTEDLIQKQLDITDEINQYETLLTTSKDQLDEEFYKGLEEDFQVMERYRYNGPDQQEGLEKYNFEGMKRTLTANREVINQVKSYIINLIPSESELLEAKLSYQNMKNVIGQYTFEFLTFDYTNLKEPEESEGFFKSIQNLAENGIMGLVVEDMEELSNKELDHRDLPSALLKVKANQEPKDISTEYTDVNLESGTESLTGTFDIIDSAMGVGDVVEGIGELILFQEYLFEHFKYYDEKDLKDNMTSLDYELEYILMGKSKDIDNLKAIVIRILLIRTILNVISLISDSKRSGDAKLLAAAFVGFTGLPALVTIVKTLILFIWSFVESLVDLGALLRGKEIPLLKGKNDILVELQELILTSKEFIKKKVDNIKTNHSFAALSYKDYLRIFLFIESHRNKNFRSMDLIQENLQLRYEDTFLMQHCLYGFGVVGEFGMEEKFIALPFVRELIDAEKGAYRFHITKEYSY